MSRVLITTDLRVSKIESGWDVCHGRVVHGREGTGVWYWLDLSNGSSDGLARFLVYYKGKTTLKTRLVVFVALEDSRGEKAS